MEAGLGYLLPSEVLLFVLLPLLLPESPPALLLEELPEDFSELPELAGALEPALPPLPSLLAEAESELPSDFVEDEEAAAGLLRA
jgi:hypothetical protein